jgi:hypothetical protein
MFLLWIWGFWRAECLVEIGLAVHPHLDIFWLNNYEELTTRGFRMWDFLYQMNQRSSR